MEGGGEVTAKILHFPTKKAFVACFTNLLIPSSCTNADGFQMVTVCIDGIFVFSYPSRVKNIFLKDLVEQTRKPPEE